MNDEGPSPSAVTVAALRAAHQVFDDPVVFDDPLAVQVFGRDPARPGHPSVRASLVARSRFAEDEAAAAVGRGVGQLVVLGAGLETFAHRQPHGDLVRVFEVDRHEMQEWKRARFLAAGLAPPDNLTYVAHELGSGDLGAALAAAGFDGTRPAAVWMLGVAIYLPEPIVWDVVTWAGTLPAGTSLVFDYGMPPALLPEDQRAARDAAVDRAAGRGERFVSFLDPTDLAVRAGGLGFTEVEDLGWAEINARYFAGRADELRVSPSGRRLVALRR